jgi:hypothetical protein
MTTTSIIRDMLKTSIRDLREVRRSKSSSMVVQYGYTIAIKDSFFSINQIDDGYNFLATWNRKSTYWTKEVATKNMVEVQAQRPELDLEVVHQNDLMERIEAYATSILKSYTKFRNLKTA